MKRVYFLFIILFSLSIRSFAQQIITGTITDIDGNPLQEIKIKVKDINKKALSLKDGSYTINVPEGYTTLIITSPSYLTQEIEITSQNPVINVIMNKDNDIFQLSLEELLNVRIVTASNKKEKLLEAPATTIVISKEQIHERGYKDLIEVLQELPGIDMSVTWGDTYSKEYVRGYRNTIGSPYLFMIDGIIFNDLYFNHTTAMAATPLSNIEQIEVVYGPASSVYGPNAFMGVINVITKKDSQQETTITGNLSSSVKGYTWADLNIFQKFEKTKLSITARFEDGNLNQMIDNNDFYWLQDKFLTDEKLWGDFVNNPRLAGKFSSPIKNTGVDFRLYHDNFELSAQYFENYTGFGNAYPADRTPPQSLWILPDYSVYGRYHHDFSENLNSITTIRYRVSNVSNESQDLEGYNIENTGTGDLTIGGGTVVAPGESIRVIKLTYWQLFTSSRSIFQDFEWNTNKKLSFKAGFKYEDKDLQKAYDLNSGELFFPETLVDLTDALPPYPITPKQSYNRINWIDTGIYAQGKYYVTETGIFNLGYRIDKNSSYGVTPTLRTGYVQKFNKVNLKFLYGQAFQEPTPRNLYGGWLGSGADPNLKPEKSQTFEISISHTKPSYGNLLSLWWVNNINTIVNTASGAQNLGERNVIGLDYLTQIELPAFRKTKFQLYYSLIIKEEEDKFDSNNVKTGTGNIGDLSHHKIHFGLTSYLTKNLILNFKGQYRGEADLVSTNPLKTLPDYFVLDGNLTSRNFGIKDLELSLKVTNLLNTRYYHPGLREADSGQSGGVWNGRSWEGSGGWYNSLLPQPRRVIIFGMSFRP